MAPKASQRKKKAGPRTRQGTRTKRPSLLWVCPRRPRQTLCHLLWVLAVERGQVCLQIKEKAARSCFCLREGACWRRTRLPGQAPGTGRLRLKWPRQPIFSRTVSLCIPPSSLAGSRADVRDPQGVWRAGPGERRAGCWAQSPCSATKGGAGWAYTPALPATVGFGAEWPIKRGSQQIQGLSVLLSKHCLSLTNGSQATKSPGICTHSVKSGCVSTL